MIRSIHPVSNPLPEKGSSIKSIACWCVFSNYKDTGYCAIIKVSYSSAATNTTEALFLCKDASCCATTIKEGHSGAATNTTAALFL